MTSPQPPLDEARVREILCGATDDRDAIVTAEQIGRVVVEDAWMSVALAVDDPSRDLARRAHARLAQALPDVEIEVRAGPHIFRGGDGFGAGRHIVAVLGGKGGVGKSTVAVNLALTLAAMGNRVGLVDCDVNAPDVPHMLGLRLDAPAKRSGFSITPRHLPARSKWRRPHERYGVEFTSVGLEVPERLPPRITSRGLVSMLLRNFVFEVVWQADVLVIDAPPGTGEEIQAIAAEIPLSGALFVTTPQDLAQLDAGRTLTLLREHDIEVIGLVKNMAAMRCPHCDEEIDMFAESQRLRDAGVPALGSISFDIGLSRAADRGVPLVLADPSGPLAREFARIGAGVRRWLRERDERAAAQRVSA